jgi:hypothetical protein
MFTPEESIGIQATEYLEDLGFELENYSEYVGDAIIDDEIIADDGHPEHKEMSEEYFENLEVRHRWFSADGEIIISWSDAEIISYSKGISSEIVNSLKSLIDDNRTIYISNDMSAELEHNSNTTGE